MAWNYFPPPGWDWSEGGCVSRSPGVWAAVYEKVVSNYPGLVIPGQSGADDIVMMVMR